MAGRRPSPARPPRIPGPSAAIEAEFAQMYWGGAQQQDDATASERELSALVRDKVRAARRAQQFEEAERILNPPGDGGDGVAAEAWRNAHEATRTALETQRQEAQEARSAAATAHQRVDQARTEGLQAGLRVADREVASVRAEAEAKVDAMARVAEMAVSTVKEVAQARSEADRASADARVAAVQEVAGLYKGMLEVSVGGKFGTAPGAPQPAPSFADQMRGLAEALKVVREVAGPTQESAMDYRIRALTDGQVKAQTEQTGALTRFLENHAGPGFQSLIEKIPVVLESFKPGTSGTFPAAPPPK